MSADFMLMLTAEQAATIAGLPAPSTFLLRRGGRTVRPIWMRTAALERRGAEPVDIDVGHCPHMAHPEQVADALTH